MQEFAFAFIYKFQLHKVPLAHFSSLCRSRLGQPCLCWATGFVNP